jgi:hypothetical protein
MLKRDHRCPFTGTWRRNVIATGVVPAMEPCYPCTVLRLARSVVEEAGRLADMDEDEKAGEPLGFKHTMHRNNHLRRTTEVFVRKSYDCTDPQEVRELLRSQKNCQERYRCTLATARGSASWCEAVIASRMAAHEKSRISRMKWRCLDCNHPAVECTGRNRKPGCRTPPLIEPRFDLLAPHLEALAPIVREKEARSEYARERSFLVWKAWKAARLVWRRRFPELEDCGRRDVADAIIDI